MSDLGGSATQDEISRGGPVGTGEVPRGGRARVSKKMVAVAVVLIVVSASVGAIWYFYFRHWSIQEIAEQVILDPDENSPGFKHNLAGRSVVVEGEVTQIKNASTNLGILNRVELDGLSQISLMYREPVTFEVGDRIERRVAFEWSRCNDERHVYSPDLSFPVIEIYNLGPYVYSLSFHNRLYGGTVEVSNEGPDVKTLVTWLREPIPSDSVNCTLRSGRWSWVNELLDVAGNYRDNNVADRMESLAFRAGVNGTLEFIDANSDSYLDSGDYFLFKNLGRPVEKSGLMTYMMLLEWPAEPWEADQEGNQASVYYPMTSEGVVWPDIIRAPLVRFHASSEGLVEKFTFDFVDQAVAWDDITFSLCGGVDWSNWCPAAANFSGTSPHVIVFPSQEVYYSLPYEELPVILTCVDALGDGLIQEGDYFTFEVAGGLCFPEEIRFDLRVISEWTHDTVGVSAGIIAGDEPLSTLTLSEMDSAVMVEFSTVYNGTAWSDGLFDVCWDELQFVLSSASDEDTIQPAEGFLRGIPGSSMTLGTFTLGTLSVVCNVTDLNGDGQVNRGDFMTVSPLGTEEFLPSESYTLSLVYIPESSVMASAEFTG